LLQRTNLLFSTISDLRKLDKLNSEPVMDFSKSIYAGLSGVKLSCENFELGAGLTLSKTYAHLMVPFLMAFKEAPSGKHHPGPISPVNGGLGFDIHTQILIPEDFKPARWFDRINSVWWLAVLIRLRLGPDISVTVATDRPFSSIPVASDKAELVPIEVCFRKIVPVEQRRLLEESDLVWIRDNWHAAGLLMADSDDFNAAVRAFDYSSNAGSEPSAMMALWGGIEQLFSPDKEKNELRFRISASIASYLEEPGENRLNLHKKVRKLYDARSRIAHSAKSDIAEALTDTYSLVRLILTQIIERRHVPSRVDLENRLFGCATKE
jgi:hypothetical protein